MNQVLVRTKDGHQYALSGYASRISEIINEGRGKGKLVALERALIPTGQMVYLDPDEVVSIKDDR